MIEKIKETVAFIQEKVNFKPEVGIILGTGLGGLVKEINIKYSLDYSAIKNFPVSTVEGHSGKMIFGELGGKNVIAMQGRFHYYEGYEMSEVTFPVRVLKFLGIKHLFVSNAAGGLNPDYRVGDLMVIDDHINFFPRNPLIGKNNPDFGPRFPDMSEPYDKALIEKAFEIGKKNNINLKKGIYIGSSGPTFETIAEYRMFRIFGADATGMSTVPEVIIARHMGIPVFGISVITNIGVDSSKDNENSHEDVQKAGNEAEPKMTLIMKELVASL